MSTMTSTIPFFPAITITTFPTNPKTLILKQCKTRKHLNQIHAHLIKTRLLNNPSIAENLLESAAILLPENSMDYAVSIFRVLNEPNSSIYNLLIRGFTLKQTPFESIVYFKQMLEDFVEPDEFTYPCALKACSRLGALSEGEQIHAQVVKSGFGSDGFVQNTLIHFYANCGKIEVARKVFDEMSESERTLYTWNSMLSGYTRSGFWEEGVNFFREMRDLDVRFNYVTLVSVLSACGRLADLELGEWICNYIKVNGLEGNSSLITSLVDMYAKCGCLDIAKSIFDKMSRRDVVAWSAMISGYSQANLCREALNLFHEMQKSSVDPNEVTMVSVLSSCATLGALETGKWVHTYIKKKRLNLTVTLGTTLIEFYAKCGCVNDSIDVFNNLPSKNAWSWTVLIQGLANNGQAKRALKYFKIMQEKNIEPNDVTFISVLSACSHAGFVEEGKLFFGSMSIDFGIEPRIEHYGIMVDILGRAGLIEEAYQFIESMPIKPNDVVWRTLLASCKIHKNIEYGEESLKKLVGLEPAHSGDYILLSNIFASVGRWEDALKVRSDMKKKGIKKTPGCSMIEFDGRIHEFFAEDNLHPYSKEIYDFVEKMMNRIKLNGYEPNTEEARLDAEECDRETSVSHHSEKLAIAFGLIRTSPGTTIRISKNLRVCIDCHNASKIISKVYDREIVVRDRNRFHHFKEGSCSCNDFW